MADRNLPTPEELHNLLRYEPETGRLYWRERTPEMFGGAAPSAACKTWNARYAGRMARSGFSTNGYEQVTVWGRRLLVHRVAIAITSGAWPQHDVDHVNGVTTDNRLENLRPASRSENMMNSRMGSKNTSGATGVTWDKSRSMWKVSVRLMGVTHNVGRFHSLEEAAAAARAKYVALGFTERHLSAC